MPEPVRARVFEPFFITKPPGEGVGVGLSLAHDAVVPGHGGALTAESVEGDGSTFILRLPERVPSRATPRAAAVARALFHTATVYSTADAPHHGTEIVWSRRIRTPPVACPASSPPLSRSPRPQEPSSLCSSPRDASDLYVSARRAT